jgi:hypothetical protein
LNLYFVKLRAGTSPAQKERVNVLLMCSYHLLNYFQT